MIVNKPQTHKTFGKVFYEEERASLDHKGY